MMTDIDKSRMKHWESNTLPVESAERLKAATCLTDSAIRSAWEDYHGAIDLGDGDEYIPVTPPQFIRGYVDGYEHGKAKMVDEFRTALTECRELVVEAERDEINIMDELEKWDRAYGHLISQNERDIT